MAASRQRICPLCSGPWNTLKIEGKTECSKIQNNPGEKLAVVCERMLTREKAYFFQREQSQGKRAFQNNNKVLQGPSQAANLMQDLKFALDPAGAVLQRL